MVQPAANSIPVPGSPSYRRAILQRQVDSYVRGGFMVVSQTDSTAQLRKPKQFSCLWAAIWFLFFGVGIVVYLIYYASKQDELVFIEVNESGQVNYQGSKQINNKHMINGIGIFIIMLLLVVCVLAVIAINTPNVLPPY